MAQRDTVHFDGTSHQRKNANRQWTWYETPFGELDPNVPPWLVILGVLSVHHQTIPVVSSTKDWKVRGSYEPKDGEWQIKFRIQVGDEEQTTLFTPLFEDGTFEMTIGEEYLMFGQTTWVWFEGCSHTPSSTPPLLTDNALRITVEG